MDSLLARLGIEKLSSHQQSVLSKLKESKDLFVVMPTGSGKSVSFQLAPFCSEPHSLVLIVMPLLSLIEQQVQRLTSKGFRAIHVTSGGQLSLTDLLNCETEKPTHVFATPEALEKKISPCLQGLNTPLSHVFIDESHCVAKWGYSDSKTIAFREAYSEIGNIRIFSPTAMFVALTATASKAVEETICNLLQMVDYSVIRLSPEKENIRYSVVTVQEDIESFAWLKKRLLEGSCEKTLIFFKDYNSLGKVFRHLQNSVPKESVEMFHSMISSDRKLQIADRFTADPSLRVVLCTSAFSMGMDISDIHHVVHYGAPADLEQYVQETGRAGRDGHLSHATLLRHRYALAGTVSETMKEYVNTKECRRIVLLREFDSVPSGKAQHCCDNCSICNCVTDCICDFKSPAEIFTDQKPEQQVMRTVISAGNLSLLKSDILQLAHKFTSLPSNITNIYPELVQKILEQHQFISNAEDIYELGAFCKTDADCILQQLDKYSDLIDD